MNKCVYILLDHRTPKGIYEYSSFSFEHEPFYIGKGNSNRPFDHIREAKRNLSKVNDKLIKIREILEETRKNPIVLVMKNSITDHEAIELESKLIESIGRTISVPPGPLTNLKYRDRVIDASASHKKKLEKVGYDYLNFNSDGTPRVREYYSESDNWKNCKNKPAPFFNSIPWLNYTANDISKLGWYYKDDIISLSINNPGLGTYRLCKKFKEQFNIPNDCKFSHNHVRKILEYVKSELWTQHKQKIWKEWKDEYTPLNFN